MRFMFLFAAFLASAPASANLLVNGGFESAPTTPLRIDATAPGGHVQSFSGGAIVTSQYLPGWTIARPFESDLHRAPSAYGGYPANAFEGQQYFALNWSNAAGITLVNTISQAFTLGNGATGITLALAMSSEVGFVGSTLTASIRNAGGNIVASSGAFNNTLGNARWDQKSWAANLGAGTYSLALTGVGSGNAWDVLVDDVVLDQVGNAVGGVPEPASWAMLIAGFGLTGAVMRRRAARVLEGAP